MLWRAAIVSIFLAIPAAGQDLAANSRWVRLNSPNFELFASGGEKTGRDAIHYFEQVRAFFMKATPVRPPDGFPVRVIAFKNRQEFSAYTPNPGSVAYFTGGPRRDYIVMADATSQSYPFAVHEYMHLIVRHSGLRIPVWLNEGWADVYSSLKTVKGGMAVGDLLPGRMQVLEKAAGNWLDFETLTSVTTRSPIYNEGDRTGLFYAESWALAHMLFLAPDYRDNFGKFVMALHRGSSAADACRIAYGKSSTQVFLDLQNYFSRKKMFGAVFETGAGRAEIRPESAPVSEFDARVMLADLSATLGRFDEARAQYEDLEKRQPGRPEVTQSLGYLALMRKDYPAARQYFDKAFAAGDSDPRMCLQLAILAREAKQPPGAIVPYLERAVQSKPDYGDALLQLGMQRVALRQFEPAVKAFMSIQNVTPDRAPQLFASLAYADLETGDLENARTHLQTARKWAKSPAETQALDSLGELLEARAKTPNPPHPGEKTESVEGTVQALDCLAGHTRLRVGVGGKAMSFDLPDPKAVEFSSVRGPDAGPLRLRCGPSQPMPIRIDYAPAAGPAEGVAGVVRRLEY